MNGSNSLKSDMENKLIWSDLVNMQPQILKEWYDDSIRCIIIRGPASLCAYVGIPLDHPLAGFNYENIPIRCHGGMNFAGEGDAEYRPSGYYWYGWDYSHGGDYVFYYDTVPGLSGSDNKKWLVEDVENDMWSTVYDFKSLVKLAELIKNKTS